MAILTVKGLSKYFPVRTGLLLRESSVVKAVDNVSFEMEAGKTVGLVGESGCGKSTLGRTIVRLLKPTAGDVLYNETNLSQLSNKQFNELRKEIQIIFQDPYSSLDPKQTIYQIIAEPLAVHNFSGDKRQRVRELMDEVGLNPSHLNRYPHEFSGGQRQRISIARAIALTPKLIIADEAVSALDVSIQAQILNLLKELQQKYNLSILFISHDLSVIRHMSDTVIVMYLGKIVEIAPREELFNNPVHPYTKALLAAIPSLDEVQKRQVLTGEVPSPITPPSGCTFHPRCPVATDKCSTKIPNINDWVDGAHKAACYEIGD